MTDNDFIIRFRADVQAAIDSMNLLVAAAGAAESAINRVQSAQSAKGGAQLARQAQGAASAFANLGVSVDDLDARLQKIGPRMARGFSDAIRALPGQLGKIELFRNANQLVPATLLQQSIRGFKALETVFNDDAIAAQRFRREAQSLSRELVAQSRVKIRSLMDQADRAGSRGDQRLQINSLRAAEKELIGLQRAGITVDRTLAKLRLSLVALGQPVKLGIRSEIEGLLPRIRALRETAEARGLLGNQEGRLSTLKQLEELLTRLSVRGANVANNLASVRTQISAVTTAINNQTTAQARQTALDRLQERARVRREDVLVAQNTQPIDGQIRALRRLEDALVRLRMRGVDTRAEISNIRREIVALGGASTNLKSIERLQATLARLQKRQQERLDTGQQPSRLLERRAELTALELVARGHTQAATAAATHARNLVAMGPAINTEVAGLLRERDALLASIRAREAVNQRPTAGQLGRGFDINTRLADAAGRAGLSDILNNATNDVGRFSTAINANRGFLDQWSAAFGGHARRIAEGLLIYNAFGAALGGVQQAFSLIANLDREMARFEAVAGNLTQTGANDFIANMGQIAIKTNTPLLELVSTMDQVAASFVGLVPESEIADASNAFQELAGKFSNVTGQAQDLVTTNLVSLFRQTRRESDSSAESMERFGALLDIITTAGFNSSSVISDVVDGLREASSSAKTGGADFSVLAFAIAQVAQETGESGLSIGNTLKTVLGNLATGSKVADVFGDIADTIVQVTDGSGNLLRSTDILRNLFNAVEEGALTTGQAREIFRDLGPQIQPGQIGVVNQIFDAIGAGLDRMEKELPTAQGALEELSNTIVNSLGGRFEGILRRLEDLVARGLLDPFVSAGEAIVDVVDAIINVLSNPLAGAIIGTTAQVIAITGAFSLVATVVGKASTVIQSLWARAMAGIIGGSTAAAASMTGLGTASGAAAAAQGTATVIYGASGQVLSTVVATGANAAAGGMGRFAIATGLAKAAIRTFLPFLIAMIAIDVVKWIGDATAEFGRMQRVIEGFGDAGAGAEFGDLTAAIEGRRAPNPRPIGGTLSAAGNEWNSRATQQQIRNVDIFREKLAELDQQGNLTEEKFHAMAAVILTSTGKIKESAITTEELDKALSGITNDSSVEDYFNLNSQSIEDYINQISSATDNLDELTAAEQRSADAARINAGLFGERAAFLAEQNRLLAEGSITLDEYADAQRNSADAAEVASEFVATFGDQLDLIPGLVERIAQTGESPAEALMNMLLANPEVISQQIDTIRQMIDLVVQSEEALNANPLTPQVGNEEFSLEVGKAIGTMSTMGKARDITNDNLSQNPITPKIDNSLIKAQVSEYIKILDTLNKASQTIKKAFGKNLGGLGKGGDGSIDVSGDLEELLRQIGAGFGTTSGIGPDDPRLGGSGSSATNQTGIIDIGDLPPSMIQQVVAMATAAQNKIKAAGGEVDDDDITALLANGQFQQLVRGVDQRLLTEALQQLTDVEKKRLELEQQRLQDVTRSLVTQVGPIQSLISSPVLGNQGGLLTGQGLNADPRNGNFTINVPINWSGMNLSQLQKFIYDTISKAWIDAGRGG